MFNRRSHFGVVVAALLLSGCSFLDNTADSVWSSLSGEDSDASAKPPSDSDKDNAGGAGTVVAIPPANAESNPQPTLTQQPLAGTGNYAAPQPTLTQQPRAGAGNYAAPPTVPGSPTGTYVGAKVVAMRGDLQRLQENINRQNSDLQQLRQTDGAGRVRLLRTCRHHQFAPADRHDAGQPRAHQPMEPGAGRARPHERRDRPAEQLVECRRRATPRSQPICSTP